MKKKILIVDDEVDALGRLRRFVAQPAHDLDDDRHDRRRECGAEQTEERAAGDRRSEDDDGVHRETPLRQLRLDDRLHDVLGDQDHDEQPEPEVVEGPGPVGGRHC